MTKDVQIEFVAGKPAIAFEQSGEGAPLVFLHGIGGNRTNWKAQLRYFGQTRMAVALDFRGYGDSADAGNDLQFGDFSADVLRVIDHLNLGMIDLVGLSMGGLVAQDFYARHPERVRSLALIACRPGSAPLAPGEAGASFVQDRLAPILAGGAAALAESMAPKLIGSNASSSARDEIKKSLLALRPDSYLATLKARVSVAPVLDPGSIEVPVLVMAGEDDQVAPPAQMEALAAAIPDSRLEMFAKTGHLLNIEQPARFNAALESFLAAQNVQSIHRQTADAIQTTEK
jgi:3-oxoadipate enol-lactonase